jgi:hypothetical protein
MSLLRLDTAEPSLTNYQTMYKVVDDRGTRMFLQDGVRSAMDYKA